jgi:hydrogenase-4 component B
MMAERIVLVAIAIAASSGVLGLPWGRRSAVGQWLSTLLAVAGGGLGIAGVAGYWSAHDSRPITMPWPLVPGAEFSVAVDGLSAVFLIPIFAVFALGSVYGLGYWKQSEHPLNGRKLRVFYGFLAAGMAMVAMARNGVLFLFAWEIMAVSAFFLVATEDDQEDVRAASWLYLVSTHMATLSLFGMFALMRAASGSFALAPIADTSISYGMASSIFGLALLGFGIKAGIMPLHVWLPSSHAMAPSHVSAIMSGVIIKMGVYGLMRITSLLPAPVEWGAVVFLLGAVSAVLAVAFAIGQQGLKRMLAYSSVENIGIVFMGLGLAMIGRSLDRVDLIVLGLAGAVLHVWNHSLFKSLLFFCAGSVVHAAHTRDMDRLGGLAKRMPWTSLCFLAGSVAICGLPPLNAFVSEFLIYLGLFATLGSDHHALLSGAALGAPVLALVGALAVACFVRAYGVVFLGVPRSEKAALAHESRPTMLAPMAALVAGCFTIGLVPSLVVPALGEAVNVWAPQAADAYGELARLAPWGSLETMSALLLATLAVVGLLLRARIGRAHVQESVTWGCGYTGGTPRIQYTSTSFGEMLVGLFAWALRPREHNPTIKRLFPQEAFYRSQVQDPVLDEAMLPALSETARWLSWFRVFQQGSIHIYLLYIFVALITLLLLT